MPPCNVTVVGTHEALGLCWLALEAGFHCMARGTHQTRPHPVSHAWSLVTAKGHTHTRVSRASKGVITPSQGECRNGCHRTAEARLLGLRSVGSHGEHPDGRQPPRPTQPLPRPAGGGLVDAECRRMEHEAWGMGIRQGRDALHEARRRSTKADRDGSAGHTLAARHHASTAARTGTRDGW